MIPLHHVPVLARKNVCKECLRLLDPNPNHNNGNSATGTRTRVARVRAEYPNQLDYSGSGHATHAAQLTHTQQLAQNQPAAMRDHKCISRESNPGHIDGNDVFYH